MPNTFNHINVLSTRLSLLNNKTHLTKTEKLEKSNLENQFHKLNIDQLNNHKVSTMSQQFFQVNNVTEQMKRFLQVEIEHALITAPTQVGKTNAIIQMVKECIAQGKGVILSSDNKTDQQEQIYQRLLGGLALVRCKLMKVDKKFTKNFNEALKDGLAPIIFCLDNKAQIRKVGENVMYQYDPDETTIESFVVIHDEGDVVNKSENTYENLSDAALSHKEWVKVFKGFQRHQYNIKRVFVTATPLNCLVNYPIHSQFIMRLTIPNHYVSYKELQHQSLPLHPDDMINTIQHHINYNTAHNDFTAILYITDRKINNHNESLNQFKNLKGKFIVHTYNSNGIVFKNPFPQFLKKIKQHTQILFNNRGIVKIDMPIKDFYFIIKESGIHTAITIGMDMISRGISFVSKQPDDGSFDIPMAANVMIYNPSKKLHNVAINQTIGRLTGTARPDLPRYLYCTNNVYENYMACNQNQEYILNELASKQVLSCNHIRNLMLPQEQTRKMDRTKVKIDRKLQYAKDDLDISSSYNKEQFKNLIDKWLVETNNDTIAKIFRFVKEN